MPNKIDEIVIKLVSDVQLAYQNNTYLDIQDRIIQAKSELRKMIEECVPKKKNEIVNYDTYDRDAVIYNSCRTETLKNIGKLFNE